METHDPSQQGGHSQDETMQMEGHERESEVLQPRIYVASLRDYHAGIEHGVWIDAAQLPERLRNEVWTMLEASPTAREEGLRAEGWAIHDYQDSGGVQLSEFEPMEAVSYIACGIAACGPAFAHWAMHVGLFDLVQLADDLRSYLHVVDEPQAVYVFDERR